VPRDLDAERTRFLSLLVHRPKRMVAPMFELSGHPCEAPGCKGVLVDHMNLKTKEVFRRCSVCNQEFHRMPASEMLAHARRTIQRVLNGEKLS